MRRTLKLTALLAFAGSAIASQAVVVMDQIGSNPADLSGGAYTSQRFEAGMTQFDVAAIDNFSVTASQLTITQVQAAVLGFTGGFSSFNNVQSWAVEIYSSVNAGASNLTGDVGHVVLTPGQVTLNTAYAPSITNSALVTLPVSITLPSAGTYWVAVVARMDFGNGQVGPMDSSFANGFPNGTDAQQINPGNGFHLDFNNDGIEDNHAYITDFNDNRVNLAYRVTAVPEPATLAALGLGAAALLRRRRKA